MNRIGLLSLLSILLLGLSACNNGDNSSIGGSINKSEVAIQKSILSISDSTTFPYGENSSNRYSLVISNNSTNAMNLESSSLVFSSLGESAVFSEMVKVDACSKISPNSECMLPISLPHDVSHSHGYFDFSLEYKDSSTHDTYKLTKLINYSSQIASDSGVMYESSPTDTMVEANTNFKVVVPFILDGGFKNVSLDINGKRLSKDSIQCNDSNAKSSNSTITSSGSCSAIVELDNTDSNPKLTFHTTDEAGHEFTPPSVSLKFAFGNMAYLTYGGAPLIFPINKESSDPVLVTNNGTKDAFDLSFRIESSVANQNLRLYKETKNANDAPLCNNIINLEAGKSCRLVYTSAATNPGFAKANITYKNGLYSMLIKDSFMIYLTQPSYVTLTQPSIPVIQNGGDFSFEVVLHGDIPTKITPDLDTSNPYGYDMSVISPTSCDLNTTKRKCEFKVTPLRFDGQVEASTTGYGFGKIVFKTTDNISFKGTDVARYRVDNNTVSDTIGNKFKLTWKSNISSVMKVESYSYESGIVGESYANIIANTGDFYTTSNASKNQCKNVESTADCYMDGIIKFNLSEDNKSYDIKFRISRNNGTNESPMTNGTSNTLTPMLPSFDFTPESTDLKQLKEGTYTATVYLNLRTRNMNSVAGQIRVDLVIKKPFVPYPAGSCKLNSNDPGDACDCLQDTTTGDVWTRKPSKNNQSHNTLMSSDGYIKSLNTNKMCGFNDNRWDLPSKAQLDTMSNYVSEVPNGKKGKWFNDNGFSEIMNNGLYWGQCKSDNDCVLPSGTRGNAWEIYMERGYVGYGNQNDSDVNTYGWGVHSKPGTGS